jgi:hypothetical protein
MRFSLISSTLVILAIATLSVTSTLSVVAIAQTTEKAPAETQESMRFVPTIDEMASEWLEVAELAHMPSLHNFHDMAACSPDLMGVNYNPDGQLFDWPTGPRWFRYLTLPLVKLKVNGHEYETTKCRWYPHQAVRQHSMDGLVVETVVRMMFEGGGLLYEVTATNSSQEEKTVDLTMDIPGSEVAGSPVRAIAYESNDPKLATSHGFGDSTGKKEKDAKLEMVHAFVELPESLKSDDSYVAATWKKVLKPGESTNVHLVMVHGWNSGKFPSPELVDTALDSAKQFTEIWDGIKSNWEKRWKQMFTPGNDHFSGHLPVLKSSNKELSDIYYRSILTLLVLHRTNMNACDRTFVTSGERAKGVVFFWDTSMWSKVFGLLEPKGMKEHAKIFLACDPHKGPVYSMDTRQQWEGWYAANDSTIFTFVNEYLNTTGDKEFLDEKIDDRTVLEHLDSLATNWQELQTDKSIMLADYGENKNLLECAPAYIHRVPSFNAANVWMMLSMANIQEERGNTARASELREWADQFGQAVLGLYKAGDGVWYALHRDGEKVELRHCYDFVCVGRYMNDDLNPSMKSEMVNFVKRELLTPTWMRAMSPKDKAAENSDRPDHGPMGAYDAWPAFTAEVMCMLGDWKDGVQFLADTQAVLYEGIYGQSREYYGDNRASRDAPVRIAMRGACMRESVGGGAFAEVIIGTLFGFRPQEGKELTLYESETDRGFEGQLFNVKYNNRLLDITSNSDGVSFRYQD